MKDFIKVSVAVDYGNGNVVQHAFNIPVDPAEVKKAAKQAIAEEKRPGKVPQKETPKFLPEFQKFLTTGDISDIKAMPDHRNVFKPCVFAQIYGISGRTVYANKPTRINNKYVGILPPAIFDDELIAEIKARTDKEEVINVVFLDDGSKPAIINDIALVDNWSELGRTFNSLYRQAKNND